MQQPLGFNWFLSWSLQKLTWKSRQADVDTCRMKGKHKVGNFHFSCGCHFGLRLWRLSPAVDCDLNASWYSLFPRNCFFHQLIESFNLQKLFALNVMKYYNSCRCCIKGSSSGAVGITGSELVSWAFWMICPRNPPCRPGHTSGLWKHSCATKASGPLVKGQHRYVFKEPWNIWH